MSYKWGEIVDKQTRENYKKLYAKLDAINYANHHEDEVPKDVKALRAVAEKKQLLDTLDKNSIEYGLTYRQLLEEAYKYYQATGQVDTHDLPQDVDGTQLVEYYNRLHANAFNIVVQRRIHNFLVQVSPILMQLENVPLDLRATKNQFERIRQSFQEQLQFLLEHGFALDFDVYNRRLEPAWLVVKMARQLTPASFKVLVKELDRYTRLRTGAENKVGYTPDKAHTKAPNKKPSAQQQAMEKRAKEQQKKEAERKKTHLSFEQDENGHLVVLPPTGK